MAVNFVQVPPASTGLKIDTAELTINGVVVERQVVCLGDSGKNTYGATAIGFSAGTGATTDIFTLYGAASKLVRPLALLISSTTATAAAYYDYLVQKRSTAASGGTSAAPTICPFDSGMAAASGVVANYTAAPTAGTSLGTIAGFKYFSGITGTAAVGPVLVRLLFGQGQIPSINLRSATEGIAVTLNGVTPANAQSHTISVIWTEEVA